jgi:hypothetical protein
MSLQSPHCAASGSTCGLSGQSRLCPLAPPCFSGRSAPSFCNRFQSDSRERRCSTGERRARYFFVAIRASVVGIVLSISMLTNLGYLLLKINVYMLSLWLCVLQLQMILSGHWNIRPRRQSLKVVSLSLSAGVL